MKRVGARAIVFDGENLLVMYRENKGRIYYTFPGGGLEENETLREGVIRECEEEFGIVVRPKQKLFYYETNKSIEHFYLAEWISGEFGSGKGEEFQPERKRGAYIPKKINVNQIEKFALMPPEVAKELSNMVKNKGLNFIKTKQIKEKTIICNYWFSLIKFCK